MAPGPDYPALFLFNVNLKKSFNWNIVVYNVSVSGVLQSDSVTYPYKYIFLFYILCHYKLLQDNDYNFLQSALFLYGQCSELRTIIPLKIFLNYF